MALWRAQSRRWRNLWVLTFAVLVGFFALGVFTLAEIKENNNKRDQQIADLQDIAEDIDAATSPEAQEEQAVAVKNLVIQIDCNTRGAFQEAIDQIVPSEGVTILQPECLEATP